MTLFSCQQLDSFPAFSLAWLQTNLTTKRKLKCNCCWIGSVCVSFCVFWAKRNGETRHVEVWVTTDMVVSQMRGNAASYWSLFATTTDQRSQSSTFSWVFTFAVMEQKAYAIKCVYLLTISKVAFLLILLHSIVSVENTKSSKMATFKLICSETRFTLLPLFLLALKRYSELSTFIW